MEIFKLAISQYFGNVINLSLAILLLPFVSFLLLFFFYNYLPRKGDIIATILTGLTFVLSVVLFIDIWQIEVAKEIFPWFVINGAKDAGFTISIKVDDLSVIMLVLVTFISFLVHLYSLEYMRGKKHYIRYYPYLGLFTFSMIGIVLSDNLLITFMFWELVGFSSYLLIGFWFEKPEAMRAAKKAFLFNRIGDTGFIIALVVIYFIFGTFEVSYIQDEFRGNLSLLNQPIIFWVGIGIFMGCIGKSAQFPLQAWLPDAMEGPTPVSALIHAATMVAAGIFLLIKVNFILSPDVLDIIAMIGAITAFMGAIPALFQTDIKKVLAFSTISQLGFMIMAIGVRVPEASLFHLITHGFFKAGLFLGAGSVIHAMHEVKHHLFVKGQYRDFDSQDMRLMGGFRKALPWTYYTFLIFAASLMGLPLFSGFLSKDSILEGVIHWAGNNSGIGFIVSALAMLTMFITAIYMTRQIVFVFLGKGRLVKHYPASEEVFGKMKESSLLIRLPLILLAVLSLWIVFSPNPFSASQGWVFRAESGVLTAILSSTISIGGIFLGLLIFRNKVDSFFENFINQNVGISRWLKNNWNLDNAYYFVMVRPGFLVAKWFTKADQKIIDRFVNFLGMTTVVFGHILAWLDKVLVDGIVNLVAKIAGKLGKTFGQFQGGKVQKYFLFALLSSLIFIIWIIISD